MTKRLVYLLVGTIVIIACIMVFLPSRTPLAKGSPSIHCIPAWTACLPATRPQEPNTYDVIIVGGGFGGLSCGALLARDGYHVLVLEKNDQVGGYGANDLVNRYIFSYGAQDISGVWDRGCVTYLLRNLNMNEQTLLVRNDRRFILNGDAIDIPAIDNGVEKVLSDRFPGQAEAVHAFFSDARQVYAEAFDTDVIREWGVPLRKELLTKIMAEEWLQPYSNRHAHMEQWKQKTYKSVLDEYFQNEEIKAVLCNMLGYIGASASKNSAFNVIIASGYLFFGGYHVLGGSQHLADSLAKYISEHHGAVLYQHRVDTIIVKDEAVQGVGVGKQIFKAPVVVSNVNAKTLYLTLIPETQLPQQFRNEIQELPEGGSAFLVFAGASQVFPTYPAVISDIDHRVHIINNSHADPSMAPLGTTSITIIQHATLKDFPSPHSIGYDSKTSALKNETIEKASLSLPGLRSHLVCSKIVAPRDLQELTCIPQGAIYCFDESSVQSRPYFKSPIRGLYLANASSAGGGVEAVIIGGITCKHDITGWKKQKS